MGDEQVTRRVFVAGADHSHELERVNETIARLRQESDAGLAVSVEDERNYMKCMRALSAAPASWRQARPGRLGRVTEETGPTYREVWDHSDHRELLVDAGIQFMLVQPSRSTPASGFRPSNDPAVRPTQEDLMVREG